MDAPQSPRFSPVLVLFFGVLGISSGSILVRFSQGEGVPSLVIAAWRLSFATLILLPLAFGKKREEIASLSLADWRLAVLSGLMLAVHFASWISSLAFTSVASSTVLVTTSPLWVGLAAPLLLGEKLTRPLRAGIFLALVGSVLIGLGDVMAVVDGRLLFSLTQFTSQPDPLLGNGLAIIGAIAAAFYLIIGRRLRQKLSLLSYITVVYGSAAIFLLLIALGSGHHLFGYSLAAYGFMLLMAVMPQLIGHSSYNWALGYLPAAYVSIAVIAEPIGATMLAVIFFQEIPGIFTLIGSAFILLGVVIASKRNGEKIE
ncbi:MAG: DMT family transporter [Candidatus Promineifilaceae bacterium]